VWGKYYSDALGKMSNLQPGGNSKAVNDAIANAQLLVAGETAKVIGEL